MSYKSKKQLDAKSRLSNSSDAFDQKFAAKYKAEIDEVQFNTQQREALLAQLRYEKAAAVRPDRPEKKAPLHRRPILAFVSILVLGLAVSFIWSQYQNVDTSLPLSSNDNQAVGQLDDKSSSSPDDMNMAEEGKDGSGSIAAEDQETTGLTSQAGSAANSGSTDAESATEVNSGVEATDSDGGLASDLPGVNDPSGGGQVTGAGPTEEAGLSSEPYPFQEVVEDWYLKFLIDKGIETSSTNNGSTGGGSQGGIGFPALKPENAYSLAAEWMAFHGLIRDSNREYQILANHRYIAESQTHEFLLYIYNGRNGAADAIELMDDWSIESLQADGWHSESNKSGESSHLLSASLDAVQANLYKRIDATKISLPSPTYLYLRFEGDLDLATSYRLRFETAEGPSYLGFTY